MWTAFPLIRETEECNRFLSFSFYIFFKSSWSPMQSVAVVEIFVRMTSLPFIGNAQIFHVKSLTLKSKTTFPFEGNKEHISKLELWLKLWGFKKNFLKIQRGGKILDEFLLFYLNFEKSERTLSGYKPAGYESASFKWQKISLYICTAHQGHEQEHMLPAMTIWNTSEWTSS